MLCRAIGRRPAHRPKSICHWHAGGEIKPLHHARTLASGERLRLDSPDEERPRIGWLRSGHDGQCAQEDGDRYACPVVAIINLGSWQGAVRSRPLHHRVRHKSILRRSAQSMAARNEREHERPITTILSKGHRPVPVEHRGDSSRCPYAQLPAQKIAWLEDPSRIPGRVSKICSTI